MTARTNWAGNYTYRAGHLLIPETVDELRDIAASSAALRVLGSAHSFNDIADSREHQVSLAALDPDISIDSTARTVSLSGGVRYGELAKALDAQGWALHNLASLPHISVVGAVSTGTHGSGDRNGILSTEVVGLEIATSTGDLVHLSAADSDFAGAVVGLGALGVVARIELAIEPTYQMRQNVFENLTWDSVDTHFDAITSTGYSVSLFTDWSASGVRQALVKSRVDQPGGGELDDFFGATPATVNRHPLPGLSPANVTEQLGVPGPWFERLPHFRLDFTPSNGEEIQSEYLIPREHAVPAMHALRSIGTHISPLLFTGEIRTMRADDLWLSPAYDRDAVGFHFTWVRDQPQVESVLPLIEEALAPFAARPHWGKVFTSSASELTPLYPRMSDFRALVARFDSRGAFQNDFTRRYAV